MTAHELDARIEGDFEMLHVAFKWVCNEKGNPGRKCATPVPVNACPDRESCGECGGWWFEGDHYHAHPDPINAECMYAPWFENLDGGFEGDWKVKIPLGDINFTDDPFPIAQLGGDA